MPSLTTEDVLNRHRPELKEVQVPYTSHKDFEAKAKKLKIMFDFRVSPYNIITSVTLSLPALYRVESHEQLTRVLSVSCTEVAGFI